MINFSELFHYFGIIGKKIAHHLTFIELTNGGVDLLTGKVIDGEILNDFPFFSIRTDGEK